MFSPQEMAWEDDPLLYDVTCPTDIALLPDVVSAVDGDLVLLPEPTIVVTPPEDRSREEEAEETIPTRPSAQFARDTWWDALLSFYAEDHGFGASDMQLVAISHVQRNTAMKSIMSDLRALFQSSPCWTSFLHLPRFFDTLFSPVRRKSLQPSLMLASLALGTLSQSSEAEYGSKGRNKALKLLDMANGAIESSLATGWVDIGLAQAAMVRPSLPSLGFLWKLAFTRFIDDCIFRDALSSQAELRSLEVIVTLSRFSPPPFRSDQNR